ncbi:hypothetical protein F5B20DRAFT_534194 [Whalleya microplaca]|nr:hypothetical protein F5B20DRAFT_534194 [Whalleya microplaca]
MSRHSTDGSRGESHSFPYHPHAFNLHQPALDARIAPCAYSQPRPSFQHPYYANATPVFIHPLAPRGGPVNGHEEASKKAPRAHHTSRTASIGVNRGVNSEMRVSLAAKQLSNQLCESRNLWIAFREEYEKEVASIKTYVDDSILQQIWRKKIEYNSKYSSGDYQEDEQFTIQYMKLGSCLDQINEAANILASVQQSDYRSSSGSRNHHLKKIRIIGNAVAKLSSKTMTNGAACTELLAEMAELEKLVDPKNPAAKVLHRFDKRETKKPTRPKAQHAQEQAYESASSTEPKPGGSRGQVDRSAAPTEPELQNDQGEHNQNGTSADDPAEDDEQKEPGWES